MENAFYYGLMVGVALGVGASSIIVLLAGLTSERYWRISVFIETDTKQNDRSD